MKFTKYHGLGNDFIFLEDFGGSLLADGEKLAKQLCHRHFGIGADGLVFITQENGLYTMRIFNSDGSEAGMCGNAIRCLADYLLKNSLTTGTLLTIGTITGSREIEVKDGLYVVDMGEPDFSFQHGEPVQIQLADKNWSIYPVSLGNPHGVLFVEKDFSKEEFELWGPKLEQASIWPDRANIEFTQVIAPNHLQVRVWERGAGATLACGTGASAAAVVALQLGLVDGSVRVTLPGGDLLIEWRTDNHVYMTGPATKVFSGTINI